MTLNKSDSFASGRTPPFRVWLLKYMLIHVRPINNSVVLDKRHQIV